jgi:hypothetical protein
MASVDDDDDGPAPLTDIQAVQLTPGWQDNSNTEHEPEPTQHPSVFPQGDPFPHMSADVQSDQPGPVGGASLGGIHPQTHPPVPTSHPPQAPAHPPQTASHPPFHPPQTTGHPPVQPPIFVPHPPMPVPLAQPSFIDPTVHASPSFVDPTAQQPPTVSEAPSFLDPVSQLQSQTGVFPPIPGVRGLSDGNFDAATQNRDISQFMPDPNQFFIPANNGIDIPRMLEHLLRNAFWTVDTPQWPFGVGACSRFVADAISDALADPNPLLKITQSTVGDPNGKHVNSDANGGPGDGKNQGENLLQAGFVTQYGPPSPIPPNPLELLPGDVVVLSYEPKGHVAVWTGKVWVSDFIQPSVAIHSPALYKLYRYPGSWQPSE